jgi:indolepyruvate decarboxylase
MERVIAEARRNNQPAYIVVPSDYALAPITLVDVRPVTNKSNETSLQKVVAAITERLKGAKSFVAFQASRSRVSVCRKKRSDRSDWLSLRYCVDGKMHHRRKPSAICRDVFRRAVLERDTRLLKTPNWFLISEASVSTTKPRWASPRVSVLARFISIGLNDVRVGDQLFGNVRIADAALAKFKSSFLGTSDRRRMLGE